MTHMTPTLPIHSPHPLTPTHFPNSSCRCVLSHQERIGSIRAMRDLKLEMQLMCRMDHPHVLAVRAVGQHRNGMPFMCLDLLHSVLSNELPRPADDAPLWSRQKAMRRWPLTRAIHCALCLAEAMEYCHQRAFAGHRVLHRDLKPTNIGFLADGRLVLFDFGLASAWKLRDAEPPSDKERRPLTGETGSLRYMAPEVALGQQYNHKAEVFSFAGVLFEMASLQRPFSWMDSSMYLREACVQGVRPKIDCYGWPKPFVDLLTSCWHADPNMRPNFCDIVPMLRSLHAKLTLYNA